MPPELTAIADRAQVAGFFATVPASGRLDTIRLVRTRANGHPALAAYLPDRSARCHGYGKFGLARRPTEVGPGEQVRRLAS
jgi:RNA polymerase sigma-70 factor, ECF subfamily